MSKKDKKETLCLYYFYPSHRTIHNPKAANFGQTAICLQWNYKAIYVNDKRFF